MPTIKKIKKIVVKKKTLKVVKKVEKAKVASQKVLGGLKLTLLGLDGKESGVVDLPKEIFSIKSSPALLSQYVRVYLHNQRQGNATTKTRGEVVGSTRKIYRQKGTGKARHGDIKAPIFVGGGIVGGPRKKDYTLLINKKQKKKALFSALSNRNANKDIVGLSDKFLEMVPKTKIFAKFLKTAGFEKGSILLILPDMKNDNLIKASRNLAGVTLIEARSINAFEILKHKKIFMVEESFEVLKGQFLKKHDHLTSSGS